MCIPAAKTLVPPSLTQEVTCDTNQSGLIEQRLSNPRSEDGHQWFFCCEGVARMKLSTFLLILIPCLLGGAVGGMRGQLKLRGEEGVVLSY